MKRIHPRKVSIKDSFKTIVKELITLQIQVADLTKRKEDLEACLKEFIDDIMVSYGSGKNKVDSENLSWPDLETTFNKAVILLGYKKPKDTTKSDPLYPISDWKNELKEGTTTILNYTKWIEIKSGFESKQEE
jgi:CRISPR/Cas system CSM-associated protein Csm2 small subunit